MRDASTVLKYLKATTTTTTTTETTETTVTNPETGDLLTDSKVQEMGRNQKFGGDMTTDWGGQGSAAIRNGATCGDLGQDKCAEITGSGNFTQGVFLNGATAVKSDTTGISNSSGVVNLVKITQANYDALGSYDANTVYFIV